MFAKRQTGRKRIPGTQLGSPSGVTDACGAGEGGGRIEAGEVQDLGLPSGWEGRFQVQEAHLSQDEWRVNGAGGRETSVCVEGGGVEVGLF